MARARLLKPGFFQNEELAVLPYEGRLLFAGLWTLADRDGRLEDRPKRIKSMVFPFDHDVAIDDLLAGLAEHAFIVRYQAEAVAVIQITTFAEHQKPHKNEPPSKLPAISDTSTNGRRAPAEALTGDGDGDGRQASPEPPAAASVPVLAYPCVGKRLTWNLTADQVAEWERLFPHTDVLTECKKALAWLAANPNRRKTFAGMPRFLTAWLTRSVDTRSGGDRRHEQRLSYQPTVNPYAGWEDECKALHGYACGHYRDHALKMQLAAAKLENAS